MLKLHHFEQEEPQMISPTDRDAVEKTLDGFTHVWNRHDMDAMAELVTGDCDWVNVVGMHWKGKAAVLKAHKAFHGGMFRDVSLHEIDRQIAEIAPGVALAIATSRLDDYLTPDGRRIVDPRARTTWVLTKQEDRWLVRSAHNTTVDPVAAKYDPAK
jgi:uncharacterized protein (TIGR02246 family)